MTTVTSNNALQGTDNDCGEGSKVSECIKMASLPALVGYPVIVFIWVYAAIYYYTHAIIIIVCLVVLLSFMPGYPPPPHPESFMLRHSRYLVCPGSSTLLYAQVVLPSYMAVKYLKHSGRGSSIN